MTNAVALQTSCCLGLSFLLLLTRVKIVARVARLLLNFHGVNGLVCIRFERLELIQIFL